MTKHIVANKPRLTKWFDGSKFVPAHVGVYQRAYGNEIWYSHWDGIKFSCGCRNVNASEKHQGFYSSAQQLNWRGLAEKAVHP